MFSLNVNTSKKKEVYDLTDEVNSLLKENSLKEGFCTVYIKHTTAAITVADMDPGAEEDYMMAFDKLIPNLEYNHPHDPKHMPDHIMGALIGPSVSIPVKNSKLNLGTWQKLVLMEFSGPRERNIEVVISKSS